MRIAISSLDQAWEDKSRNLEVCLSQMRMVAAHGADGIIFPEMTLTGFSNNRGLIELAPEEAEVTTPFRDAAAKLKIGVIFGALVKGSGGLLPENKAFCIGKDGTLVCDYAKIHPFSMSGEHRLLQAGDRIASGGFMEHRLGLTICYDLRFPEIYSALAGSSDLIVNIANWPAKRVEHWRTLLRARAIENQVFVIGVNRVGLDGNGIEYVESSLAFDANGDDVPSQEIGAGLKILTVDKEITRNLRNRFDSFSDRRPGLYRSLL